MDRRKKQSIFDEDSLSNYSIHYMDSYYPKKKFNPCFPKISELDRSSMLFTEQLGCPVTYCMNVDCRESEESVKPRNRKKRSSSIPVRRKRDNIGKQIQMIECRFVDMCKSNEEMMNKQEEQERRRSKEKDKNKKITPRGREKKSSKTKVADVHSGININDPKEKEVGKDKKKGLFRSKATGVNKEKDPKGKDQDKVKKKVLPKRKDKDVISLKIVTDSKENVPVAEKESFKKARSMDPVKKSEISKPKSAEKKPTKPFFVDKSTISFADDESECKKRCICNAIWPSKSSDYSVASKDSNRGSMKPRSFDDPPDRNSPEPRSFKFPNSNSADSNREAHRKDGTVSKPGPIKCDSVEDETDGMKFRNSSRKKSRTWKNETNSNADKGSDIKVASNLSKNDGQLQKKISTVDSNQDSKIEEPGPGGSKSVDDHEEVNVNPQDHNNPERQSNYHYNYYRSVNKIVSKPVVQDESNYGPNGTSEEEINAQDGENPDPVKYRPVITQDYEEEIITIHDFSDSSKESSYYDTPPHETAKSKISKTVDFDTSFSEIPREISMENRSKLLDEKVVVKKNVQKIQSSMKPTQKLIKSNTIEMKKKSCHFEEVRAESKHKPIDLTDKSKKKPIDFDSKKKPSQTLGPGPRNEDEEYVLSSKIYPKDSIKKFRRAYERPVFKSKSKVADDDSCIEDRKTSSKNIITYKSSFHAVFAPKPDAKPIVEDQPSIDPSDINFDDVAKNGAPEKKSRSFGPSKHSNGLERKQTEPNSKRKITVEVSTQIARAASDYDSNCNTGHDAKKKPISSPRARSLSDNLMETSDECDPEFESAHVVKKPTSARARSYFVPNNSMEHSEEDVDDSTHTVTIKPNATEHTSARPPSFFVSDSSTKSLQEDEYDPECNPNDIHTRTRTLDFKSHTLISQKNRYNSRSNYVPVKIDENQDDFEPTNVQRNISKKQRNFDPNIKPQVVDAKIQCETGFKNNFVETSTKRAFDPKSRERAPRNFERKNNLHQTSTKRAFDPKSCSPLIIEKLECDLENPDKKTRAFDDESKNLYKDQTHAQKATKFLKNVECLIKACTGFSKDSSEKSVFASDFAVIQPPKQPSRNKKKTINAQEKPKPPQPTYIPQEDSLNEHIIQDLNDSIQQNYVTGNIDNEVYLQKSVCLSDTIRDSRTQISLLEPHNQSLEHETICDNKHKIVDDNNSLTSICKQKDRTNSQIIVKNLCINVPPSDEANIKYTVTIQGNQDNKLPQRRCRRLLRNQNSSIMYMMKRCVLSFFVTIAIIVLLDSLGYLQSIFYCN